MKTQHQFGLIFAFLIISKSIFAQGTINFSGTIVGPDKEPIAGANVIIEGTTMGAQTDLDGNFTIKEIPNNSALIISYVGYTTERIEASDLLNMETTKIELGNASIPGGGGASSVSMLNYWVGAKVGYNFIGDSDDNFFVGNASVSINLLNLKSEKKARSSKGPKAKLERGIRKPINQFGVIGNIGNFKFKESGDNADDLKKIAQSINGISVGLGFTHQFDELQDNENLVQSAWRWFARTGARYTSFEDVGEENETVNLAQFVTNFGLEWELYGFKNGGALSLSTGVSLFLFDDNLYNKVFEEEKSSLTTLDINLTLPLSKTIGLYTNGTFAPNTSAAFLMGIIIRPELNKKEGED